MQVGLSPRMTSKTVDTQFPYKACATQSLQALQAYYSPNLTP